MAQYSSLDLIYATDMLAELRGFQGQSIEQMPYSIPHMLWIVFSNPQVVCWSKSALVYQIVPKVKWVTLIKIGGKEKYWLINYLIK